MVNKDTIKNIIFKYPDLMSPYAEAHIIKEYNDIVKFKKDLQNLRTKELKLESLIKEKEKEFKDKSHLFTLEFEEEKIKEIHNEVNIAIVNPGDYRNKH